MELCLLQFTLPTNLVLPGDKTYYFQHLDRVVAIQPVTKHGARIFVYERNYAEWINSQDMIYIHEGEEHGATPPLGGYKIDLPPTDFQGGVIDYVDYTSLRIIFENSVNDFFDNLDKHIHWATPAIQRFVDSYRIATDRGWLGRFEHADSTIVLSARADSYTFREGHCEATFTTGPLRCVVVHPIMHGRGLSAATQDQLDEFERRLKSGTNPHLDEMLFMEAAVQAVRHKNFDLAIVHLETGFEVFVQRLLLDYCVRNSVQSLPGPKANKVGIQQAIETGNIQNDLFRYIYHLINTDPKSTNEYPDWLNDLYNPRVSIEHRGARGTTENDAIKAQNAASSFMGRLRTLLT